MNTHQKYLPSGILSSARFKASGVSHQKWIKSLKLEPTIDMELVVAI